MNLRILKRRAEMLDAVSTGLHPSAVVAQLAEKYGVTERALWSDWQRREKWGSCASEFGIVNEHAVLRYHPQTPLFSALAIQENCLKWLV